MKLLLFPLLSLGPIGLAPAKRALPVSEGGTGGFTAAQARFNLGIPNLSSVAGPGTGSIVIAPTAPIRGDLLAGATTAGQWLKIPILSSSNKVLRSNGSDPSWGQVVLTTDVTGLLPLANLTAGTATTVLHGSTPPSYSAVSLTADVSGILPIASGGIGPTLVLPAVNGGTGLSTTTSGSFLVGGAANTMGYFTPAADGKMIRSVGGGWQQFTKGSTTQVLKGDGGLGVPDWGGVNLTSDVIGQLPVGSGGTGLATIPDGSLLVGNGISNPSTLADVIAGNALISGGVGLAPSYGKIGLTTHISGILPIANGGTGPTLVLPVANGGTSATSFTANRALVGNGTSAILATNLQIDSFGNISCGLAANDAGFEIGALGAGDRNSYIDLHSDDTFTDFGLRLLKLAGQNGAGSFQIRGTGGMTFTTIEAGTMAFQTNNTTRLHITATTGFIGLGTASPLSTLHIQGSLTVLRTQVANINYSQVASDYIIGYSSLTTSSKTVTLLPAATAGPGKMIIVKDESGNASPSLQIIIDGNGSETIDGSPTKVIQVPYGTYALYCTGTAWFTASFGAS